MSDNQAAALEEEPSRLQALAKRMRCMGADSSNEQTQGSAVSAEHAVHAEPSGSTTQSRQPAATAARCVLAAHTSALHCCCIPHVAQRDRAPLLVSCLDLALLSSTTLNSVYLPSVESCFDECCFQLYCLSSCNIGDKASTRTKGSLCCSPAKNLFSEYGSPSVPNQLHSTGCCFCSASLDKQHAKTVCQP